VNSVESVARSFLKKATNASNEELKAVCPFHRKPDGSEERNPSFYINRNNGLWFCHACHTNGNFYSFLRSAGIAHVQIVSEYKYVLDEAGRHAPAAADPLNPIEPTKEPLQDSILGLFDYYPKLMEDEGFPMDLCRKFDVGFDERHLRVTFPLRNTMGRLVGISGRTVTDAVPRYKVYDTEYLDFGLPERKTEKRAILWNAHEALVAINLERDPRARRLVIVEGFKGAMRVAQAGISTVVALLGSYISMEQLFFIEKLAPTIYMMWDNNTAGRSGCLQAVPRLMASTTALHFVEYDAPQPSDLTPEEVRTAIADAPLFLSWYARKVITPEEPSSIPLIEEAPNGIR
jgi:DNA primase